MSHLSLVVASCVVIFSTVHADPRSVHFQCLMAGYSGACIESPSRGIFPSRCSNLMCARAVDENHHIAYGTGSAADGTYCGLNKECFRGQCIEVPSRIVTRPHGLDAKFICYRMPDESAKAYDQLRNDYDASHDDSGIDDYYPEY